MSHHKGAPDLGDTELWEVPEDSGPLKVAQIAVQGLPRPSARTHTGCGQPVKVGPSPVTKHYHLMCPAHGIIHVSEVTTNWGA